MFNNDNPITNGELSFYNAIKGKINTIFDVGCRSDTLFDSFEGDVHYFDPMVEFINRLSAQPNTNKASYYNTFGLGNETTEMYYYPMYQSFYDRINSCKVSDDKDKFLLKIRKAKDYILENNINNIDFLKIDTEGYEFNVLKGFEDKLDIIKVIQFEYGGTYLDNNTNLIDVINYLKERGFDNFSYLVNNGMVPITDFTDHYKYCNIVCTNKNIDFNITF